MMAYGRRCNKSIDGLKLTPFSTQRCLERCCHFSIFRFQMVAFEGLAKSRPFGDVLLNPG